MRVIGVEIHNFLLQSASYRLNYCRTLLRVPLEYNARCLAFGLDFGPESMININDLKSGFK